MEEAIRGRPGENARADIAAVIKTLIRTLSVRAGRRGCPGRSEGCRGGNRCDTQGATLMTEAMPTSAAS